jgi:hypothetical protein
MKIEEAREISNEGKRENIFMIFFLINMCKILTVHYKSVDYHQSNGLQNSPMVGDLFNSPTLDLALQHCSGGDVEIIKKLNKIK